MDLPKWIKYAFLFIIGFSCFTCYARPDYNLPLFAFAYLLWDYEKPPQKTRLTYTFLFTLIIDFTWLIYWGTFWDSSVFDNSWASGIQTFVLVLSSLSFVVKFMLIAAIIFNEVDVRKGLTLTGAKENLLSVFDNSSSDSSPPVRR